MPLLHFYHRERELFVHALRTGRTMVGRSDRCDIALPSEGVSRVHCVIDDKQGTWWVTDRSRNGTLVNGVAIDGRRQLADGDRIAAGNYTASFSTTAGPELSAATVAMAVKPVVHEELVEVRDDRMAASRVTAEFHGGPLEGESRVLDRVRTSLGGPGSDITLDETLPKHAIHIRVVRGRPMVEPGSTPVFLAGTRVRELVPADLGETIRIGDHELMLTKDLVEQQASELDGFGEMVGRSASMKRLFGTLQRVAAHDAPVLLIGESGTGKELAARGIHQAGPRNDANFVPINCAAIAENLFESELFGHEKGAFTGADSRQDGAFQHADGGTIFLDEIGEMRLDLQAKLLRVLESGEVRRVGGRTVSYPDVRVVAATNRDLVAMIREGTFREDLYYRLSVLAVRLPPLRQRKEDIPIIAGAILERQHPTASLRPDAIAALKTYDWPGNARELRNVLTRAFVLAGPTLSAADLEFNPWAFEGGDNQPRPFRQAVVEDAEQDRLRETLAAQGGNRTATARALGIPRSSLLYKLKKYGIR